MENENLLTRTEAAAYLTMKPQTLATWAMLKTGPPFIKVGRNVRYRRADLDAWLASRREAADLAEVK